jgi:propanol-preferring alcohol dehydrogenase
MAVALRRLKIVGSVTGSMKDVEEALDFTARGLVRVSIAKDDKNLIAVSNIL